MLVKCKADGTKIDRDSAYKYEHYTKSGTKQNWYFRSEEEYKKYTHEVETRKRVFMIISDIFGYTVVNTAMNKEINPLIDQFGCDKVFDYLYDNQQSLSNYMAKDFNSEYGKIRYFSAIIKSHIKDFETDNKQVIKQVEVEDFDFKHKYKQKKKRRALADLEDDI